MMNIYLLEAQAAVCKLETKEQSSDLSGFKIA